MKLNPGLSGKQITASVASGLGDANSATDVSVMCKMNGCDGICKGECVLSHLSCALLLVCFMFA